MSATSSSEDTSMGGILAPTLESSPRLGASGRKGELSPLDTKTGTFMLAFCEERRAGPLTSPGSRWTT
eukprot:3680573-Pyramimonas_sp.AAC.1